MAEWAQEGVDTLNNLLNKIINCAKYKDCEFDGYYCEFVV
jgi:hypothetical protein